MIRFLCDRNSSKGHVLSPWMDVNSLCKNTVAPKMNLPKTAKKNLKLVPKISAGRKIPLQWLCLSSLLHSTWKRPGCGVQYPRFRYTSPGDVLYHELPNSAQSKATAMVPGVQKQLFFFISVLSVGALGLRRVLVIPTCLSCPRRCQGAQKQATLAGL